jgi:hypothetical protein
MTSTSTSSARRNARPDVRRAPGRLSGDSCANANARCRRCSATLADNDPPHTAYPDTRLSSSGSTSGGGTARVPARRRTTTRPHGVDRDRILDDQSQSELEVGSGFRVAESSSDRLRCPYLAESTTHHLRPAAPQHRPQTETNEQSTDTYDPRRWSAPEPVPVAPLKRHRPTPQGGSRSPPTFRMRHWMHLTNDWVGRRIPPRLELVAVDTTEVSAPQVACRCAADALLGAID